MEYEVGLYKREKSTRIGVGLGTKPDGDGVKVKELVPDRLAALSGKLQEGDVGLEVNGQHVSDREGAAAAEEGTWRTLVMPECPALFEPILYALPAQLLAYHAAVAKGTDVDQPRNLAKSVTVE